MILAGLFVIERGLFMDSPHKGRFYRDGRFATLKDVVKHYNTFFQGLMQTPQFVTGASGGTPYTLACERLLAALGLVSRRIKACLLR